VPGRDDNVGQQVDLSWMTMAAGAIKNIPGKFLNSFGKNVQTVIPSIKQDTNFSPLQPLPPQLQGDRRRYDLEVGENVSYIPRGKERYSAEQLRNLAENCTLLRGAIENLKDTLSLVNGTIQWRDKSRNKKDTGSDPKIKAVMDLFHKPDHRRFFPQWRREWEDDMLVIDGVAIEIERDRIYRPCGFLTMDASSIKTLIDERGRIPLPPAPAYQQIIKGIPGVDFRMDELVYFIRNPRSYKNYGFSAVEMTVIIANMAIRRDIQNLQWFTEGTIPDAIASVPKEWGKEQIMEWQDYQNFLMNNTAMRRKVMYVPDGTRFDSVKKPIIDNTEKFDEMLARVFCWIVGVPVQPLVKEMNRATAEQGSATSKQQGPYPMLKSEKCIMDHLIYAIDPAMEWVWLEEESTDPKERNDIDVASVKSGLKQIDEVRQANGDEPLGPEWQSQFIKPVNAAPAFGGDEGGEKVRSVKKKFTAYGSAVRFKVLK
jgi:hypothetical protein